MLNLVMFEPFIRVRRYDYKNITGAEISCRTKLIHYTDKHFTDNPVLTAWLSDDRYISIHLRKPVRVGIYHRKTQKWMDWSRGFVYWKEMLPTKLRKCKQCGNIKEYTAFPKDGHRGRKTICKICHCKNEKLRYKNLRPEGM